MNQTDTRPSIRVKGSLLWTEVYGNIVELWFASPTGDSSDTLTFRMNCVSNAQAVTIANHHNATWKIPHTHELAKIVDTHSEDCVDTDLI